MSFRLGSKPLRIFWKTCLNTGASLERGSTCHTVWNQIQATRHRDSESHTQQRRNISQRWICSSYWRQKQEDYYASNDHGSISSSYAYDMKGKDHSANMHSYNICGEHLRTTCFGEPELLNRAFEHIQTRSLSNTRDLFQALWKIPHTKFRMCQILQNMLTNIMRINTVCQCTMQYCQILCAHTWALICRAWVQLWYKRRGKEQAFWNTSMQSDTVSMGSTTQRRLVMMRRKNATL